MKAFRGLSGGAASGLKYITPSGSRLQRHPEPAKICRWRYRGRGKPMHNSVKIELPKSQIEAFCRKFGVEEFSLFGSVLRDDFGTDSDVDVMLKFLPGRGFTFENTPDIQDELQLIFKRPVDVIEKGRVRNPIRRRAIMSSYQVVYAA
jgi:predicted nucleotidyltransferase